MYRRFAAVELLITVLLAVGAGLTWASQTPRSSQAAGITLLVVLSTLALVSVIAQPETVRVPVPASEN